MTVTRRVNGVDPADDADEPLQIFDNAAVEYIPWSTRMRRVFTDFMGCVVLAVVVAASAAVLAILVWWLWQVVHHSMTGTPAPECPVTPPDIRGDDRATGF